MAEEGDLLINGKVYDPNTMTFRENREARRITREEVYDGDPPPEAEMSMSDTLPAIAVVLVRRDDPSFTLDQALDLVPSEVLVSAEQAKVLNKAAKRPPTVVKPVTPAKTG
jgi:hypothetical protein